MCADSRGNGQVGERPSALFHVGMTTDSVLMIPGQSRRFVRCKRRLQWEPPLEACHRTLSVGMTTVARAGISGPGRRDPLQIDRGLRVQGRIAV